MPEYKLTYFQARGAAEFLRFMFHHKGVAFTDEQVTREEWPALKTKYGGATVPLLHVDGRRLTETVAIAQYLGGEFGLSGADSWEAAQCTFVAGIFKDMIPPKQSAIFKAMRAGDQAAIEAATTEFVRDALPPYFERLEAVLAANGGEWFVGKQATWADLLIAEKNEMYASKAEGAPIFAKSALLEAHYKRVYELPGIKEYAAKRPDTPF